MPPDLDKIFEIYMHKRKLTLHSNFERSNLLIYSHIAQDLASSYIAPSLRFSKNQDIVLIQIQNDKTRSNKRRSQ
jgi:hypothetical protein